MSASTYDSFVSKSDMLSPLNLKMNEDRGYICLTHRAGTQHAHTPP